jgi:hypothetical protein
VSGRQIDFGYDQLADTGGFLGWIDDLRHRVTPRITQATVLPGPDPEPSTIACVSPPSLRRAAGGRRVLGGFRW